MIKKKSDHKVLHTFPQLGFSVARLEHTFGSCFQRRWLEAKYTGCLPSRQTNGRKRNYFSMKNGSEVATTSSARRRGTNYERKDPGAVLGRPVSGMNLTLANSIQTKAAFSHGLAVRRLGHEECSQIGARFAVVVGNAIWKPSESTKGTQSWDPPIGFVPTVKRITILSLNSLWYCSKPTFSRY